MVIKIIKLILKHTHIALQMTEVCIPISAELLLHIGGNEDERNVEYALLLGIISIAAIIAIKAIGTKVGELFEEAKTNLETNT